MRYLSLFKVQVFADGGEQPAEALEGLFVVILQQLHHTVVHDGLGQHLQLEELADELYVAEGPPAGYVFGLLQRHLQALTLLVLRKTHSQR